MSVVPVTTLTADGVELDDALAATGADTIQDNDGLLVIEITNPTGGSLTCVFSSTYEIGGQALSDRTVTVPANTTVWIRPLAPAFFNDTYGDVAVVADVGLLLRGLRF